MTKIRVLEIHLSKQISSDDTDVIPVMLAYDISLDKCMSRAISSNRFLLKLIYLEGSKPVSLQTASLIFGIRWNRFLAACSIDCSSCSTQVSGLVTFKHPFVCLFSNLPDRILEMSLKFHRLCMHCLPLIYLYRQVKDLQSIKDKHERSSQM